MEEVDSIKDVATGIPHFVKKGDTCMAFHSHWIG